MIINKTENISWLHPDLMRKSGKEKLAMAKKVKFWALLGILIFLLLNFPLLQIFNRDTLLAGIPLLVLFLHVVWILAIVGLYSLSSRLTSRE
jgi:glucan phosphoethanolaminetransferase (alkaline phosphatase superfamily)